MSTPLDREFERILIIKPSSPGDIIHALPVLHGLRRRFPRAKIDWLIATPFVDLIAADPALTEAIPFDRARYGHMLRSPRIAMEFFRFARSLRERQYEMVIDLQGLFRSGFLARASRAKVRIGFANARELAWIFYSHRIPLASADTHAADRNYAVASMLGFDDAPMDFSLSITRDDRANAAALLAGAGFGAGEPFAVLVPATRWETKTWPAERYADLAARLNKQRGIRSVLVGGPGDVQTGAEISRASGGTAVNLCGKTSLRELAAIIEIASFVVTADSTPMHMAAALDRPLVALFGPTNPSRTGPYGRNSDVVRLELPCSPCYFRRLSQCPYDHGCMRRLEVDTVEQAVAARVDHANGTVLEKSI